MDAVMTCLRRTLLSSPKQRGVSYPIRYSTLFWLFMLGSVAGFVLEGLWCVLCKGHWEHHSATVWGPFCLIYGIGTVAVYLLSVVLKSKNLLVQSGCLPYPALLWNILAACSRNCASVLFPGITVNTC